jgi:outer membrane protein OmpA-like peptidoglycan-associated protein
MRNFMFKIAGIALLPGFLACATAKPPSEELLKAREASSNAERGPATQLDPADLHEARVALDVAEDASSKDPESFTARQRAYIALRRSELADAQGKTAAAAKSRDEYTMQEHQLKDALLARTQGKVANLSAQNAAVSGQLAATNGQLAATNGQLAATSGQLAATQGALADANAQQAQTAAQLQAEHDARIAAEAKAMDALAKLGAVKNDERGLVLTLSGSVVFASNKSTLLPGAQKRLDDVASALRDSPRNIRIEGNTDSVGSDAKNQALSQARAESVMNYLVSQNIPQTRVTAVGLGSSRPVADNKTAEGRANNRRVEIILLKDAQGSADNR